jgi:hypothetical protein
MVFKLHFNHIDFDMHWTCGHLEIQKMGHYYLYPQCYRDTYNFIQV